MRSQQRTSWGFDSDADPRLEVRRAAAESQRPSDTDDVADDARLTTIDPARPIASREPDAIGRASRRDGR